MNETVDPGSIVRAHPSAPPPQGTPPRSYRMGKIALALALAAILIVIGLYVEKIGPSTLDAGKPVAPAGPPPQTVRAVEATVGDMPITINALGTVTPLATVTVKTQVAGKLIEVGFTEGQSVKKGDFLAQVDDRPFQATLAQAAAQLAKDTSLHEQAQADLERYQTLMKQDSISRQQVDDQVFLVAQDAAAMVNDQAQIDAAKLNIAYAHIVSPIDGRVGLRLVDAGNYVQPTDSTGLVVITQLDPISVIFSTPEDNLARITRRLNAGAKLSVTLFDRANVKQIATGELTTFDNLIDTTTGTFKLRATFANKDNALFASQFVNVRLLVDTLKGATIVPNAAVQLGSIGSFVYVVKDDSTVTVRKVQTGPADTARTVVASGLEVGEKVVVDGADRLREGSKVRVSQAPAAAGAATPGTAAGDDAGDGAAASGQHHHRHPADAAGATPAPAAPSPGATP